MSIILGLDPGTSTIGFAVIESERNTKKILNLGIISTPAKTDLGLKLLDIGNDLEALISTYHPDVCAIEKLYFGTNITTAIDVAQCRGVLVHIVTKHGIHLREFTPLQVKKGICGNGRAVKKQVQNTLKMLFKLEDVPKPDDAADALAIAYLASLGV